MMRREGQIRLHVLPILIAVGLLLVGFSGCVGSQDSGADNGFRPVERWEEGTWWSYEVSGKLPASWMQDWFYIYPGEYAMDHLPEVKEVDQTATFVAVKDPRSEDPGHHVDWIVSDDPEINFLSRFGLTMVNDWSIGAGWVKGVDGSGFLGSKGWVPAKMFAWPLEDGKEWTSSMYGKELRMKVLQEIDGRFILEGRIGKDPVLQYSYDSDANWLGFFRVLDHGEIVFEADLVDHGRNYEGVYYTSGYVDGAACFTTNPGMLPVYASSPVGCNGLGFEAVSGGQDLFWYNLAYVSEGPGNLAFTYDGPSSDPPEVWHRDTCPCDESLMGVTRDLDPGWYGWEYNLQALSGSERWLIFWVIYECHNEYERQGGEVMLVDECEGSG